MVERVKFVTMPSSGTVGLGVSFGSLAMPYWPRCVKPKEHWAMWYGGMAMRNDGTPIPNQTRVRVQGSVTGSVFLFSSKPSEGDGKYDDYHDKVTEYTIPVTLEADEFESRMKQ